MVELLLKSGAWCDAVRTDGASPLWIASQMGYDHIVKRLCRHGAKIDQIRNVLMLFSIRLLYIEKHILIISHFKDGATPLFKASHKGHSAVVAELLKYKPNLGLLPVSFSYYKSYF